MFNAKSPLATAAITSPVLRICLALITPSSVEKNRKYYNKLAFKVLLTSGVVKHSSDLMRGKNLSRKFSELLYEDALRVSTSKISI
jgi:hypothetical protein